MKPGGYYILEDPDRWSHSGSALTAPDGSSYMMIMTYIKDVKIRSKFITEDERKYLEAHIDSCLMFRHNDSDVSVTALFREVGE